MRITKERGDLLTTLLMLEEARLVHHYAKCQYDRLVWRPEQEQKLKMVQTMLKEVRKEVQDGESTQN